MLRTCMRQHGFSRYDSYLYETARLLEARPAASHETQVAQEETKRCQDDTEELQYARHIQVRVIVYSINNVGAAEITSVIL